MASGVFTFGESILHIYSQNREISIDLSDEGDIHVTTKNKELVQEVASGWTARGISYYAAGPKQ